MKFKIYYQEEVRRFSLDKTPTWFEFWELLHNEIFGKKQEFHKELYLEYTDNEGDNITVSSASEYDEMVKQFGETLIKVKIVEGRGSYFKDGPPAVPIALYQSLPSSSENIDDVIQQPSNVDEELIKKRVPLFLQSLFKEGRILPHHIPDWLSAAISIKPVIDPSSVDPIVDLDIDLNQLYLAIHARALKFLDEAKYDSSAEYLLIALEINPSSPTAHYNLGCVYSLSSGYPLAVHHLQMAIDLGYSDRAHMISDSDLLPLHSYPPFQHLVNTLA